MKRTHTLLALVALTASACDRQSSPQNVTSEQHTSGTSSVAASPDAAVAPVESTPDAAPAVDASAPTVAAAPIEPPYARPCSITVRSQMAATDTNCARLYRVRPTDTEFEVCNTQTTPFVFRYDANGRIVSGRNATFRWTRDRSGTRTVGRQNTAVTIDAEHRFVTVGTIRNTFDAQGRLTRQEGARRFLQYNYNADGTFTTNHNYPDSEEFCVADLVEVRRNARGLPEVERFDNCGINETAYTLRYEFGEGNRIDAVHVDLESNGSDDLHVTLTYPPAGGACPAQ